MPLSPEYSLRVADLSQAHVSRVEPAVIPDCVPAAGTASGILCHATFDTRPVTNEQWARKIASLLLWGTAYRGDSTEPELKPEIGIRFESDGSSTDVLLSLRQRRLRLASSGMPILAGTFGERYSEFLRAIAAVRPHDRELQDLVALEEQSGAEEVSGRGGEEGAIHPDTECFLAPIPEWTDYDVAPTPVTTVAPTYPLFAVDAQIQGTVVLSVFINSLGRICSIKLLKGITGLNEAAIGAVKRWTFNPAYLKGVPVAGWVDIPIGFHF